jgi:transposase InsO family protein
VSNSRPRLSAFGRSVLVSRITAGWSLRAAAAALGVSATWAWVIWHRFLAEGERAYALRSSRPHRSPRRIAVHIERRITRERRRRRWGPLRLSWLLGLARSTVYAVLRRTGLGHRRIFRTPLPPVRRYERAVPGDLVHVDTKKLGRLGVGGGKRFGPQRQSQERGWEYLHVAVDDRTRVPYVERLWGERGGDCAAFLRRAVAFFLDHGVRVRQVMTDNAFAYTRGPIFGAAVAELGLEHVRTPAYTPRWNGKAEAFIGILLREWAYARPYPHNRARAIALSAFVHSYTHRRPHGELGGLTPMQRLTQDVHNVRGQYS